MADIAFISVGKIIQVAGKIKDAVDTVKQNKEECEDIKSCVARVEEILGQLDHQTAMNPALSGTLEDLAKSVDKALELVNKCQQKHIISHLWGANSMAKKLNKVQEDIWRKLQMGNFATHVSVYKTLHPQDAGAAGTNSHGQSTSDARPEVVNSQKGKMAVGTVSRAQSDPVADSKSTPAHDKKPKYNILTRDRLLALLNQERFEIAWDLKVPEGVAEFILHHYNWSPMTVRKKWSTKREEVCKAIGLRSSDERPMSMKLSAGFGTCKLCGKDLLNRMSPGSCEHYYCKSCWHDYFSKQVGGPRWMCLNMQCPDQSCQAPVVRELVEKMADKADKDLYDGHALRSWYIEKMAYAGRIYWQWCPLDCSRAIELLGDGLNDNGVDVVCDCGHCFCLNCGRQAHQPKSCDHNARHRGMPGGDMTRSKQTTGVPEQQHKMGGGGGGVCMHGLRFQGS